jgi:hypothetical protein
VLQPGSIFLEFAVILLQDFNQVAEVFNLLSLLKFDLLEVDTVVVGTPSCWRKWWFSAVRSSITFASLLH